MERDKGILRDMLKTADFPEEILAGTPFMELTGSSRFFMENHRGVTEYTRDRIGIRVQGGTVFVSGRCLTIARMTGKQLVITGRIEFVELQGRCRE